MRIEVLITSAMANFSNASAYMVVTNKKPSKNGGQGSNNASQQQSHFNRGGNSQRGGSGGHGCGGQGNLRPICQIYGKIDYLAP
ncbi:hypothetical protein TIFTF001_034882 [Ficus carica]|uniref:Uncharacterized protein n=1 Tax=Ficus carica TaxID=3494 RepID=A0AA88E3Q0_FICCA|nr:hypothetical protein TIFTF001_034824 [Ficus carica]GMN65782.1 hypothetical protein TIFTF001_034849 [Ficus carica]GMN65784.1 hypothetical protein TIFTF001_034859 [Ficus carica]GMN65815.1 hypothetical protein TIFTF001_034882 [Ficus carica]